MEGVLSVHELDFFMTQHWPKQLSIITSFFCPCLTNLGEVEMINVFLNFSFILIGVQRNGNIALSCQLYLWQLLFSCKHSNMFRKKVPQAFLRPNWPLAIFISKMLAYKHWQIGSLNWNMYPSIKYFRMAACFSLWLPNDDSDAKLKDLVVSKSYHCFVITGGTQYVIHSLFLIVLDPLSSNNRAIICTVYLKLLLFMLTDS